MIKLILVNIFLFISSNVFAQALEQQIKYADSLFAKEKYFDAVTEYKRLLFFDKTNQFDYSANYQIGKCYKAGAKLDEAIKYFSLAKQNGNNENQIIDAELEIIKANILRRTIPEAIKLLDKLEAEYSYKIDSSSIRYWKGWAYLMGDDWEKASNEFAKIDFNHPLKKLSDKVESEQYSVNFAKISSFIIPGFGQFYTGNYLSGFLSLGWNVLWGYLTINAFMTERAVEGILIGGLLWTRFYRGNLQNAEKFAIEKNREISNRAYQYLAKEYKGEKP